MIIKSIVTLYICCFYIFPNVFQTSAEYLTQVDDEGQEHPIVYFSRVLNSRKRNYTTTERELFGLINGIKNMRPYLEEYEFVAMKDHILLKYLRNLKDPTGRLARWSLKF